MTKNLKIFLLEQQIKNLIDNSEIEVSTVYYMLKNMILEIEQVYNRQITYDYNEYTKENQNKTSSDSSAEHVTSIPIDIKLPIEGTGQE